ncbi:MAG: hypothetical protein WD749_11580 [Phycisphaerales bacterium]
MSPLLARYRALPRTARWALWAGCALVGYFVIVEPIVGLSVDLHTRADGRASLLVALDREAQSGHSHQAATAVAKFGLVDPPGNVPEQAMLAFNKRVSEVLEKHGVRNSRHTTRTLPMGPGPLTLSLATGEKAERRVAEIQFDSTPENIASVLADLERSPEVASVSRVQVRRTERDSSSRLLHATIAAEAWVITRGRAR